MKKAIDLKFAKPGLSLVLAFCMCPLASAVQLGYQHGTVVRMRMGECLPGRRGGFMVAFGPPSAGAESESCPEYTLVSDKVVFVITGRSANQLIPLADVVDFRFHNNELAVRLDDARHESKFTIKEMILRSEWDLVQKHLMNQLGSNDSATVARTGD